MPALEPGSSQHILLASLTLFCAGLEDCDDPQSTSPDARETNFQPAIKHLQATARSEHYLAILCSGARYHIRLPHVSPDGVVPPALTRAIASDVDTLRYLSKSTTLPLAPIVASDATSDNLLGRPYFVSKWVTGVPASVFWPSASEAARRRLLERVADAMVQLRTLQFPAVGRLLFDETGDWAAIGDLRVRDFAGDLRRGGAEPTFLDIPATTSTQKYLTTLHSLQASAADDPQAGAHRFLELVIRLLPPSILRPVSPATLAQPPKKKSLVEKVAGWLIRLDTTLDTRRGTLEPVAISCKSRSKVPETFCPSHPDLALEHLIVNPTSGSLEGIVGWSGVHTVPLGLGWASYPAWLLEAEHCPRHKSLQKYCDFYATTMSHLLTDAGGGHQHGENEWTRGSELWARVKHAAENPAATKECMESVFEAVFPRGLGVGRDAGGHFAGRIACAELFDMLARGVLDGALLEEVERGVKTAFSSGGHTA